MLVIVSGGLISGHTAHHMDARAVAIILTVQRIVATISVALPYEHFTHQKTADITRYLLTCDFDANLEPASIT